MIVGRVRSLRRVVQGHLGHVEAQNSLLDIDEVDISSLREGREVARDTFRDLENDDVRWLVKCRAVNNASMLPQTRNSK